LNPLIKNTHPTIFLVAFLTSFVIHLLIVLSVYYPDTTISIVLSAGMFFSWLFVSTTLKDFSGENKDFDFKSFLKRLPPSLKNLLIFFALYAFINFVITLSFDSGSGWVDFDLGHGKLRGISGFWLFFYLLAFSVAYLKNKAEAAK
jgi:hypothetical protein